MIEGMEADAANVIFCLGHQIEKLSGKGVKVSIDDHVIFLSWSCRDCSMTLDENI